MQDVYDSVVIGAGISGLVLSSRIREQNQKLAVIEKSKSVGGRIATRRDGLAAYDHGAQFYKMKNGEIFSLDQAWSKADISRVWFEKDHSVFKVAPGGLTRLAKYISQHHEIRFNEKLAKITDGEHLLLDLESGLKISARKVYLTAPLPQSLSILESSQIRYPKELSHISYAQALVGLFELELTTASDIRLSYVERPTSSIFSISNQQSKGVSSTPAMTVVMNPEWSLKHFESAEEATLNLLTSEFEAYFRSHFPALSFRVIKSQLKKWRFSHPLSKHSAPYVSLGMSNSIFLLGDAFGGASIRGAVDSALAVPL